MATVLIVEDNAANMALATFLLRSAGHSVLTAIDAEAALTVARREQPQLILMDIQLPGMDGLTATVLLKGDDLTRGIPVIALTALAMKGDEERIRAAGCDGYIAKPLAYKDFLATISASSRHAESRLGRVVRDQTMPVVSTCRASSGSRRRAPSPRGCPRCARAGIHRD